MVLFLALVIGVLTGFRAMTPPAVVAWGAHLGFLRLHRPLSFIGTIPGVLLLTIFAIGELIVDKLLGTGARTAPPGLIARILTGGLCGACLASSASEWVIGGAVAGAAGAVLGCFGGYQIRKRLVAALGVRDLYVALIEDVITIGGSILIVTRF